MNIEAKRDIKPLWFFIPLDLIFLLIIGLNIYLLINDAYLINIVVVTFFSILFIPSFLLTLRVIFNPKKPLVLTDEKIKINNLSGKYELDYQDLFYVTSSLVSEAQFVNGGTLKFYLKNGKIIKIHNVKYSRKLQEIILLKANLESFKFFEENKFIKFFHRFYQFIINLFSHLICFKRSKILENLRDIGNVFKENKAKKVFILSGNSINQDALKEILISLEKENINYYHHKTHIKNPTNEGILKLKKVYLDQNCDSILAIGGGSILDASKALGIILTNSKTLNKYKGLFKVKKKIPFLVAIPTTCGTGSENTMVTVVTVNNNKFAISSNKITPRYTYLGSEFIESLPPQLLAETTLDALTHALEAYLNNFSYRKYDKLAIEAILIIHENVLKAYLDNNLEAKTKLLKASYIAGSAFNTKMVGNIHALSHALSAYFDLPHGKTNAMVMPYILKTYIFNKKASKKMKKLAILLKITDSKDADASYKFIKYIENLLIELKIEDTFPKEIGSKIEELAKHAYKESVPFYPCPIDYSYNEFLAMYLNFKKEEETK